MFRPRLVLARSARLGRIWGQQALAFILIIGHWEAKVTASGVGNERWKTENCCTRMDWLRAFWAEPYNEFIKRSESVPVSDPETNLCGETVICWRGIGLGTRSWSVCNQGKILHSVKQPFTFHSTFEREKLSEIQGLVYSRRPRQSSYCTIMLSAWPGPCLTILEIRLKFSISPGIKVCQRHGVVVSNLRNDILLIEMDKAECVCVCVLTERERERTFSFQESSSLWNFLNGQGFPSLEEIESERDLRATHFSDFSPSLFGGLLAPHFLCSLTEKKDV